MQQNMGKMLKGLTEMQKRMRAVQAEIAAASVEGAAAGGLVKVTMTGKGEVTRVHLDPSVMSEDADTVADLVTVAIGKAYEAKEALSKEKLGDLTAGLLPLGMKIPGLG